MGGYLEVTDFDSGHVMCGVCGGCYRFIPSYAFADVARSVRTRVSTAPAKRIWAV
jgi:hypothetical protein